jgi:hypothetical protein
MATLGARRSRVWLRLTGAICFLGRPFYFVGLWKVDFDAEYIEGAEKKRRARLTRRLAAQQNIRRCLPEFGHWHSI